MGLHSRSRHATGAARERHQGERKMFSQPSVIDVAGTFVASGLEGNHRPRIKIDPKVDRSLRILSN
jgi:hypothetical protein